LEFLQSIARDQRICFAVHGDFKELVITRIAASMYDTYRID